MYKNQIVKIVTLNSIITPPQRYLGGAMCFIYTNRIAWCMNKIITLQRFNPICDIPGLKDLILDYARKKVTNHVLFYLACE
jgi:hypothetical protein